MNKEGSTLEQIVQQETHEQSRERLQEIETRTLFEIREGEYPSFQEVTISPSQGKVSFVDVNRDDFQRVVVFNGQEVEVGEEFFDIKQFNWGGIDDSYIYLGSRRHPEMPLLNNSLRDRRDNPLPYDVLVLNNENWAEGFLLEKPTIRPDSDSFAYSESIYERSRKRSFAVIDEMNTREYDNSTEEITSLMYSGDSKKAAYISRRQRFNDTFLTTIDLEKEIPKGIKHQINGATEAVFANNNQDIFSLSHHTVNKNNERVYVTPNIDDRRGWKYKKLAVAPDSEQLAYIKEGNDALTMKDPWRGNKREGKRRAYHDLMTFIIDDFEFKDSFVNLEEITWAPNSEYVVAKSTLQMFDVKHFRGDKTGHEEIEKKVSAIKFRKIGEEEELLPGKTYDDLCCIAVSSSSEHLAYFAYEGTDIILVFDDLEIPLDLKKDADPEKNKPLSMKFEEKEEDEGKTEYLEIAYKKGREIIKKKFKIKMTKQEQNAVEEWQTELEEGLFS